MRFGLRGQPVPEHHSRATVAQGCTLERRRPTYGDLALLVHLEALPGKEAELAEFLSEARTIVMGEPGTIAWVAIRFDPSGLGVYDVLPADEARDAHPAGGVGRTLGPSPGSSSPSRMSRTPTSSPARSRRSRSCRTVSPPPKMHGLWIGHVPRRE